MCNPHKGFSLASPRLLLVDDDETVRVGLQCVLEANEFEVVTAAGVNEALRWIASEHFDVLVSDLHMPGAGDGLTVVSAMRHANPQAVTIVLSALPNMAKAAAALVEQVDDVMLKPASVGSIVKTIRGLLAQEMPRRRAARAEAVAAVLERETAAIREAWLAQLQSGGGGVAALTVEERCEHLPDALRDILFRLRYPRAIGSTAQFSMATLQHGARRRRQGLGVATLAAEARALQIALFQAIEKNLDRMNLGEVPGALMAIADEVNAQLLQSIEGYENEQPVDVPWAIRYSN